MLFRIIYGAVISLWCLVAVMRCCWSITRTTGLGWKIWTENWANMFMLYKSIGAVNMFCGILLTHEAHIVLTIAMKYLCDIGHRRWQGDNVTSGLIITGTRARSPKMFFSKNIWFHNKLSGQQFNIEWSALKFVITELDAGHHEPDQSQLPRIWDLIQF